MKSTVLIMAISSDSLYTAASSAVSKPTSRLGSIGFDSPCNASDKSVGLILAAQPQVRARPVSVFFLNKANSSLLAGGFHQLNYSAQQIT
jgi:hypothetical protein